MAKNDYNTTKNTTQNKDYDASNKSQNKNSASNANNASNSKNSKNSSNKESMCHD